MPGDVGELVDGVERAVRVAELHDAFGESGPTPGSARAHSRRRC